MVADTSLQIIIQAKDSASQIFRDIGRESDGLGSKLKTLAVGIGSAVAGFASFRVVEGAIEDTTKSGEAVRTLSMQTGLSTESSSQLIVAFEKVGLTAEDAEKGLGTFAKNLVNTRDALAQGKSVSTPFADSLKVLHINAIGADGGLLPLTTTLDAIADRFATLPDSEEKAGRAMDLFGRSGRDLIPLLNLGSAGLKDAAAEADKLGLTLSGENVEKIHQYVLAQREMKESIEGVKVQIAEQLIPVLTRFAQWFTDHQGDIKNFVAKAGQDIAGFVKDFSAGIGVVQSALQWIPDNKGSIIAAIAAIGAAMAFAFGPESLAVAGLAAAVSLLGTLKQNEKIQSPLPGLYKQQAQAQAALDQGIKSGLGGGAGDPNQRRLDAINTQIAAAEATEANSLSGLTKAQADATTFTDSLGKSMKDAGDKTTQTGADIGALGQSFKSVSSVFQDALGQIRSAASALFGQPTREQAGLQLQSDQLAARIARGPATGGPGFHDVMFDGLVKQKAAIDAQLSTLQAQHSVEKDRLTLADQTLLSEGQLKDKVDTLEGATKSLTGQIQASADKIGVTLIPGFDAVVSGAYGVRDAFGDAKSAVGDFVAYVKGLGLPKASGGGAGAPQGLPNGFQGAQ